MKKLSYLIFCIFVLSCTKEVDVKQGNSQDITDYKLETKAVSDTLDVAYGTFMDSFPDSTKQLVTLSNGLVVEKVGDIYVFEGDMLFSDSTLCILEGFSVNGSRSAVTVMNYYWPYRKVPYEFDSSFSSDYRNTALEAMNTISNATGVRFIPAGSGHNNRIKFCLSNRNSSQVGMQGGTQIIHIYNNHKGVMMHEILHSLVFFHEHTRQDRDSYVIINTDNIKPEKRGNFYKYSSGFDIGEFDFDSIMLYGSLTMDTNFVYDTSVPMMTKLDGSLIYENRSYLSDGDLVGVRNIYGPPYHKFVIQQEVLEDYNDMETEIYDVDKTFMLKFYSDEACTQLSPLPYPRNIYLTRYETYCDANHQVHEGYRNMVITVPSGVTEYEIETYNHYERYIQSIPYDVNTVRYVLHNHHIGSN